MRMHMRKLTLIAANLFIAACALTYPMWVYGQVYIEPGTFGDALWQGEVANAAALPACTVSTASTIHWVVDDGSGDGYIAHCPSDGSDWVSYAFGGGGGTPAFSAITGGTNTTAAMVVGTGSSLATSGSGTIAATTSSTLAANGANCSAGSAAGGVDASGAAEDCTAYLTGITGEELADLSDVSAKSGTGTVVVTTTGAQTSGDCVEIDASGNHVASGAACGGGGVAAPLLLDGSSDVVQLTVQGHSTQTSLPFVVENSAGTDVFTVSNTGVITVPLGSAAAPTIAVGDTNTGLYAPSEGLLAIVQNGATRLIFGNPHAYMGSGLAWLADRSATATVPVMGPHVGDDNTGIGLAAGDQLSLIAGGVEGVRVEATRATLAAVLRLTAQATAPATCTAYSDLYADTSGALCWCSATNTWTVLTGGGSCV